MRRQFPLFLFLLITRSSTMALTVGLTLSACTVVGPEFKPPPVELQAEWAQTTRSHVGVATTDEKQFWSSFQDPVLLQLLRQAQIQSPTLLSAAAQVAQAETVLRSTAASFFPLLIALSAKNAILIVEVAHELCKQGMSAFDSAIEGSRRRFRPILMTSLAFILGVVPLLLGSGAGAAARKSIGLTVFSGMLASTLLAVALVPVFFVIIENWRGLKRQAEQVFTKDVAT